ncbi:DciA family protein [Flavobacterium koreense]
MAKRTSNESSISEVLQQFIQANKLEAGMDKIDVEQAWKSLMGNGVNSYTQEVILKGSTLYVKLTSAVLREELSYGKQKIIVMLNEELRKEIVKDLVLR